MASDSLDKEIAALLKRSEQLKKQAQRTQEHADAVTRKLAELLRRQTVQKAKR